MQNNINGDGPHQQNQYSPIRNTKKRTLLTPPSMTRAHTRAKLRGRNPFANHIIANAPDNNGNNYIQQINKCFAPEILDADDIFDLHDIINEICTKNVMNGEHTKEIQHLIHSIALNKNRITPLGSNLFNSTIDKLLSYYTASCGLRACIKIQKNINHNPKIKLVNDFIQILQSAHFKKQYQQIIARQKAFDEIYFSAHQDLFAAMLSPNTKRVNGECVIDVPMFQYTKLDAQTRQYISLDMCYNSFNDIKNADHTFLSQDVAIKIKANEIFCAKNKIHTLVCINKIAIGTIIKDYKTSVLTAILSMDEFCSEINVRHLPNNVIKSIMIDIIADNIISKNFNIDRRLSTDYLTK